MSRAFRWRKMLDTGVHATTEDLAKSKGIAKTYVSQILRLTLLAPEIVEAILDGRQPAELRWDNLLQGFPLEWEERTLVRPGRLPRAPARRRERPEQLVKATNNQNPMKPHNLRSNDPEQMAFESLFARPAQRSGRSEYRCRQPDGAGSPRPSRSAATSRPTSETTVKRTHMTSTSASSKL